MKADSVLDHYRVPPTVIHHAVKVLDVSQAVAAKRKRVGTEPKSLKVGKVTCSEELLMLLRLVMNDIRRSVRFVNIISECYRRIDEVVITHIVAYIKGTLTSLDITARNNNHVKLCN